MSLPGSNCNGRIYQCSWILFSAERMYALDIFQAIIRWVDNTGIQKNIEAIPIHLSIMFIEHSSNELGSIPQLHPYGLASVLNAEAIECI